MYDKYLDLKTILEIANKVIIKIDRKNYVPYLKAIENYCEKNSIFIGGKVGLHLLLNMDYSKDDFVYYLYSYDALKHTKNLMEELFKVPPITIDEISTAAHIEMGENEKKGGNILLDDINDSLMNIPINKKIAELSAKYTVDVYYRTIIEFKEFDIVIGSRPIVKFFQYEKHPKGILLQSILQKIEKSGYFLENSKLLVIHPLLRLIDIYRRLYTPYNNSDKTPYTEHIINEQNIFPLLEYSPRNYSIKNIYYNNNLKILTKFLPNSNHILVGDCAIDYIISTKPTNTDNTQRIQIITDMEINHLLSALGRVLEVPLQSNEHIVNLPQDFQLTKHTIYTTNERSQLVPIMDVFNSIQYELIPYSLQGGIKLAGICVLVRFKLIDMWSQHIISTFSNSEFVQQLMAKLETQIVELRELFYKKLVEKPENIFQIMNYAGKYQDETISKKQIRDEQRKYFPVYFAKTLLTQFKS